MNLVDATRGGGIRALAEGGGACLAERVCVDAPLPHRWAPVDYEGDLAWCDKKITALQGLGSRTIPGHARPFAPREECG
jgi:hypothetical protein